MGNPMRLEDKIRADVARWFEARGGDFVSTIKEFCQGNRSSLTNTMAMVEDLSVSVFINEGQTLNDDLRELLEYGIFDLIGKFTSTPGGEELLAEIELKAVDYLVEILADAKKEWNLNRYKISASYEELDPTNELISTEACRELDSSRAISRKDAQQQAREILDELAIYARESFRGELKKQIAINWLENPEKIRDFSWLSTLVGTTTGSTKVILTRIKHSITRAYDLKTVSDKLVLIKPD